MKRNMKMWLNMVELGNCRIFYVARAEIVCFLHMGNEVEEVESGKLSLRNHIEKIEFFPGEMNICSGPLQRNGTDKTVSVWVCLDVYVCTCVWRERKRCVNRFILKNWLRKSWKLSLKSNGMGLCELREEMHWVQRQFSSRKCVCSIKVFKWLDSAHPHYGG